LPLSRNMVSYDQVMLAADEVIFVAKRDARGAVFTLEEANKRNDLHKENINWASRLVDALQNDYFRAYFQLLEYFPASSGTAEPRYRMEVLLRLWDPYAQRMVSPGEFIGPAERLQLIPELDKWMINHVMEFLVGYPQLMDKLELVSINLSAISLRQPHLAHFIVNLLQQHQLPPHKFCFEITETQAIVNIDTARRFMQTLHEFGCHFALDDFGSGFASYAYLHQLTFDRIKIDGIFVRDMDTDPSHFAMVKSIVEMANLLDKEVIAEFVESEEVAQQLHAMGVKWGQGYHHHVPEELTRETLESRMG